MNGQIIRNRTKASGFRFWRMVLPACAAVQNIRDFILHIEALRDSFVAEGITTMARTLHVTVSERINVAQLTEVFNQLARTIPTLTGCTGCGLGGIDIHIGPGGDPETAAAVHKAAGVNGVVIALH